MAPLRKILTGITVIDNSLDKIAAPTARDKVRGVCAYLGSLSRYNTPNKYQPCPPPPPNGYGSILRYSRKRRRTDSESVPEKHDEEQAPNAKPKPKAAADKEPCLCSTATAAENISRLRRPKRKHGEAGSKPKAAENAQKSPGRSVPSAPPCSPVTPTAAKDRRRLNSLIKSVVRPSRTPVWCKPQKQAITAPHPRREVTQPRRLGRKIESTATARSTRSPRNKIVRVLWHAANYSDPE